jgi:hypothetical protein
MAIHSKKHTGVGICLSSRRMEQPSALVKTGTKFSEKSHINAEVFI